MINQHKRKDEREAVAAHEEPERAPIGARGQLRPMAAELEIAEERERRRIAGGLHDQVGQLLGIAKVKLGEALAGEPPEEVAALIGEGRELVDRAIREIRALTFELSSPVLQELGLEAALASLAERMQERHGIPCRFEQGSGPVALREELAVLLYRIVRELLWNIVKHARARHVVLAISLDGGRLRIVVEDDGVGFDASRTFDPLSAEGGLGLLSARERMGRLRGTLAIDSAPGRGTRIALTVPVGR